MSTRPHSFPRPLSAGGTEAEAKQKILLPRKIVFPLCRVRIEAPSPARISLRADTKEKCPFLFQKKSVARKSEKQGTFFFGVCRTRRSGGEEAPQAQHYHRVNSASFSFGETRLASPPPYRKKKIRIAPNKKEWDGGEARAVQHSRSGTARPLACCGADAGSWRNGDSSPNFILKIGSNLVQ